MKNRRENLWQTRFTLLMNTDEREMLTELAEAMNRTQGDAVRQAIRLATLQLQQQQPHLFMATVDTAR